MSWWFSPTCRESLLLLPAPPPCSSSLLLLPAPPPCSSSLHQVGGQRLFVFESVPGDDLLDGGVRAREEADQTHHADDRVLGGHQGRQAFRVKSYELEERGEDQRQEAAAHRADQWDDQVQLRYQDGEGAWGRRHRGNTWEATPPETGRRELMRSRIHSLRTLPPFHFKLWSLNLSQVNQVCKTPSCLLLSWIYMRILLTSM